MSKRWLDDAELVNNMAQRLVETLPLFPKRFMRVDELVRKHQMPFSHLQILIMLEECDLSIGQISARLGIAKPNITPLVDSLCQGGLTARVRDERDRRVVNVHLLEKGDVGSAKGMLIWGQQQAEEAYLSGESNPRG